MGATIGVFAASGVESTRSKRAVILGMVLLANLPDWPIPGWGHSRYYFSHSIPVGLLLVFFAVALIRSSSLRGSFYGSWHFIGASILAVFSHYLLDSFYNHGKGIALFWPVSDARVVLPIPWFSTMTKAPIFGWHNLKVWAIEFICFGLLSLVVLSIASPRLLKK